MNDANFCLFFRMNEERILIFVTEANVVNLRNAQFRIMDGTFKTVPTVFKQLYTINAPINEGQNSRMFPLLYALNSSFKYCIESFLKN